jgi:membrane fusion protein, heavy metal efflux system
MIHTSLSRTAHVFAIDRSESHLRRPLLPGRPPIVKHRLLLSVATVAFAVAAGFAAGRSLPSASIAMPVSAPSAVADPKLPVTITLSELKLANLQLQIGQAKAGPLVRAVSATGSVGYDQLHLARIKPMARGRIETLDVTAGDRVVAGQRLALLDNFDLSAAHSRVLGAEAAFSQAKAQLAAANAAYDRAANLIRSDLVTQAELEARRATVATMEADLRTKEAQLRQYHEEEARLLPVRPAAADSGSSSDQPPADSRGAIVAPFAGVVDSVSVATGEIVDPATPIFTVSDLSTVWVQADVAEKDLGLVKVGDAVEVRVNAFPGRVFTGHITYIPDAIEPTTGMAKIRCEVPNPDDALRVNMFATVTILSPQGDDGVTVPSESLQEVNGQSVVFIPTADRRFAWRAVHTGLIANGKTQITSGLAAGTPVVGQGSYWLKATLMQSTIPDQG